MAAPGDNVKCKYCGISFNANKEPSQKIGNRYAHQACFDKSQQKIFNLSSTLDYSKSKKGDLKICYYCQCNIDIAREDYGKPLINKYAHKACYEKYYTEDENYIDKMYSFLKNEAHIAYNYQLCERQRQSYIVKNGYTNEGILNALRYWYIVKHNNIDKSNGSIGIVPYVYEDAKHYYENLAKRQKNINKTIQKSMAIKDIEIKVSMPERRKERQFIDLDKIGGDE